MSTDLALVPTTRELLPESSVLNSMYAVAQRIVNTPLVPDSVKTPEAAFAIMLKGRELGMPIMASLAGLYVIKGKVSLYADAMLGLIYRDHGDHAIIITETTEERCTIVYKRQGWKEARSHTYTMAMATLAGLPKGNANWAARPANMLRARCISEVGRMAFADSIGGLYTVEEMQDLDLTTEEPRSTPPAVRTTIVAEPATRTDLETGQITTLHSAAPALAYALADAFSFAASNAGIDLGVLGILADGATPPQASAWLNSVLLQVIGIAHDGRPASTQTLADLTRLYSEYRTAGVGLKTPKRLSEGSAAWLADILTEVLHPEPFPPVQPRPVAGDVTELALEEAAVL